MLLFLIRLSDQLNIDLITAANRKMDINAQRYPVEKSRGRAEKYDKL